jgi:hypothetical protein
MVRTRGKDGRSANQKKKKISNVIQPVKDIQEDHRRDGNIKLLNTIRV